MSANVGCAVIAPAFCPPGTRARSARRPSDVWGWGVDVYITYAGVGYGRYGLCAHGWV